MSGIWKTKPDSYPDNAGISASELNNFHLLNDDDSEPQQVSNRTNSRNGHRQLARARDSIFVAARKSSRSSSKIFDDDDDYELYQSTKLNTDANRNNDRNQSMEKSRKNLRFSNLPSKASTSQDQSNNTFFNQGFQSDEDDGDDNVHSKNSKQKQKKNLVQFEIHPKQGVDMPSSQKNPNDSKNLWDEINLRKNNENQNSKDDDDDEHKQEAKKPEWDSFKSIPLDDEDSSKSSEWVKFFLKLMKLAAYLITFVLVLVFGTLAKLLFHLMSNMTRMGKKIHICNEDFDKLDPTKPYYTTLNVNNPERFTWVWILFFVLIVPDVFLFLRSGNRLLFKSFSACRSSYTILIFLTSTAEVIGISLLVYVVLPSIDIIPGFMFTNCLFLIPSLCLAIGGSSSQTSKTIIRKTLFILTFIIQFGSIIVWPIIIKWNSSEEKINDFLNFSPQDDTRFVWLLPVSATLISIGYWENFITNENNVSNKLFRYLHKIKQVPVSSKYAVQILVSTWKCLLHLISMIIIQGVLARFSNENIGSKTDTQFSAASETMSLLLANFSEIFDVHSMELVSGPQWINDHILIETDPLVPILVGLVQIVSAFICFSSIKFVCRICIQPFGFALPVTFVLPMSMSMGNLLVQFHAKNGHCSLTSWNRMFRNSFFNTHYNVFDFDQNKIVHLTFLLIWMVTFISQVLITNHIWRSSTERLANTDQLFMLPLFSTAFVDQSSMLNRQIDDVVSSSSSSRSKLKMINDQYDEPIHNDGRFLQSNPMNEDEQINIKIYACATVWHESEDELLQMLKSILRLDQDQACRMLAVKYLEVDKRVIDFYEIETHLFVDDAFDYGKTYKKNPNNLSLNRYVQTLTQVIDKAAQNVYQRYMRVRPPEICLTPYGGRIEWKLPGNNKLIAHLKDKNQIRHRKRWSQVMYMYYLLGYKIYQQEPDKQKRDILTQNTYLLALDGDINFQPESVLLLVDLMRKDHRLGAACGRIHPIGHGPMAWYQKFEYAISHWLQKATEHVFGCVLCSPGCFSLFRASALVDINVMNRYTTKPTEAIHYVQYDQGEDRWLCTLLLQQGWKVEYCAASDSFTHCPEGFDEFFIQRRRWTPSTIANIIDLLQSHKYTVRVNDNISTLYMLYQASLMLGTILSPGTIFLMLVGAMNTSFKLRNEYSFYINLAPVLVFIFVCFLCKNEIQILVAQIFSIFYAMLMLAVLVSTAIEIYDESILSPTVIFFTGMIAIFIISAVIHPQEFSCLFPLLIYFLAIPSMYLLLTLYSIINLNIVTWGTRENPVTAKPEESSLPKPKGSILSEMSDFFLGKKSSRWNFNVICCASDNTDDQLYLLHDLKSQMTNINSEILEVKNQVTSCNFYDSNEVQVLNELDQINKKFENDKNIGIDGGTNNAEPKQNDEKEEMWYYQPRWLKDENLSQARRKFITEDEKKFWKVFIKKYLKPLAVDEKQKEIKAELINLRNKAFFTMGIINVIFVLFVYLLQLHKDIFNIPLTLSRRYNGTQLMMVHMEEVEMPQYIEKKINIDPVNLILIIFFGSILLIQFIGMLLHRFGTFSHLLAFTKMNFNKTKATDIVDEKHLDQNAIGIIRSIIMLDDDDEENGGTGFQQTKDNQDIYFDMEKFFSDYYMMMRPDKAYEIVKRSKIFGNVSRRSLGNALLRRNSHFVRRASMAPQNFTFYADHITRQLNNGSNNNESSSSDNEDIETSSSSNNDHQRTDYFGHIYQLPQSNRENEFSTTIPKKTTFDNDSENNQLNDSNHHDHAQNQTLKEVAKSFVSDLLEKTVQSGILSSSPPQPEEKSIISPSLASSDSSKEMKMTYL